MTLEDWDNQNHWLKKEATSQQEIAGLLAIVERDFKDASIEELSPDARLSIVFAAALNCSTIALRAAGYRLPIEPGHHKKTIDSLRFTINFNPKLVKRLDDFRRKRAKVSYDTVGTASETEVEELFEIVVELRNSLLKWLLKNHPELIK